MPRMIGSMNRGESGLKIGKVLRGVLSQSEGHIRCVVFNFYAFLREEHLLLVAQSTPNLKRLVLPSICLLSKEAIEHAMSLWGGLESITITRMINHNHLFPAIGKYCKRITELKLTGGFEMSHARALIEHTPNLKFLSIQSIIVNFRALCNILENLKHLEIVNMCHSLITEKNETTDQVVMYSFSELEHHLPVEHYRKVLFCASRKCVICKNKIGEEFLTQDAI
ncbi:hypothetical protein PIB30_023474 [Stylosanthes scabra]|uniref:F-box/LRR-repeat protein n=1 Tax=Stylosanthes scabra TaxID=79078 RepID=A0ABU6S9S4_9FABA|nr:hypothetical protein [Stylosanthes scabra]